MKRRTKSFISLMSILIIILSTIIPSIAAVQKDPSASDLKEEYNLTCDLVESKYDHGNPNWLDGGNGGIFKDGDFEVNITFDDEKEEGNDFLSVSFSNANKPVYFVYVKYSTNGDLYYYPGGVRSASDLHVSGNNGISHVTFYYCNGMQQEYGSLEVMKSVVHSDPEGTLPSEMPDFEIMVTGPKAYSETLYLTDGESETLTGLLPGTYLVSETQPTGNYSFVSINSGSVMTNVEVVVAANQKATAAVVNRYTPDPDPGFGALHICKWVITDEGITLPDDIPDFEVLVTGPNGYEETVYISHNEAVTLNNLEPGKYYVSETQPTGEYSFETINLTATMTNYEVVVVEDETAEAAIVNKYTPDQDPDPVYGSLLICKWVIHDEGVTLPTTIPDFEILITGPDDYSKTVKLSHDEHELLEGLKPGSYLISEIAPTAPYSFVSINEEDDMTEVEVIVAENQEAKAEVVNKYTPTDDPEDPTGSIEIMKFRDRNRDGLKNGSDSWLNNIQFRLEAAPEVDTNMSVMVAPQSWTMTTGSGDFENGQIIFSGLPYGRYKLVELSPRTITAPEELKDGEMYVWVGEEQENVLIEVGNYWNTTSRPDPDPDPDPDPEIIETVTPDPVPLAPTVIEDVTEEVEEAVPLALPQTGEIPPIGAYALGSLLLLTGVFMRRKSI